MVMNWLNANLLTVNLSKTHYVPISIAKVNNAPQFFSIAVHTRLPQTRASATDKPE